jgi:UDP-N-acetylmuramate--alanine ligase
MKARGHRHVIALPSEDELPGIVAETARSGDVVVCLGAGSITNWANALPDTLAEKLREKAS